MRTTYDKIEDVMKRAGKHLCDFEFRTISIEAEWGLQYIGRSEATLGRRLREMRQDGRVTSAVRANSTFKEYALAVKAPAVAPEPEMVSSSDF